MIRVFVVGAHGDLGAQLADMSERAGLTTLRVGREFVVEGRKETFHSDDYVHLCIPALTLGAYSWLENSDATIVLHDSVMSTSVAANDTFFGGKAIAVHMLMNTNKTVVIDETVASSEKLTSLLSDIGLHPTALAVTEHDRIMALSQAPLALLCQVIHAPLRQYRSLGLLTPSGEELERALDARAASWTPATIQSLLQNPLLYELVEDMKSTLNTLEYDR